MAETETLFCEAGHEYEREVKPGRIPMWCPEHNPKNRRKAPPTQPVLQDIEPVLLNEEPDPYKYDPETGEETLWCEIGEHEWQRTRKQGKRPQSCPEHKTKAVSQAVVTKLMSVEEILERFPWVDQESLQVFRYVQGELARGRDASSVSSLQDTYKARLRSVARRGGQHLIRELE